MILFLVLLLFSTASYFNPEVDTLYACQQKLIAFNTAKDIFNSKKPRKVYEEKALLVLCDDAMLCFLKAKKAFPNSEFANRMLVVGNDMHRPRCNRHRFNTGKFYECTMKLNLGTENIKIRLNSTNPDDCELSEEDIQNLIILVGKECHPDAKKELESVRGDVKRILCNKTD